MDDFQLRYRRFLKAVEENQLDGFLTSKPANLRYLFNLDASLGFAVTRESETILLVDSRYIETARQDAVNCQVKLASGSPVQALKELLRELFPTNRSHLGFESDHLPYRAVTDLKAARPRASLVATSEVIEILRQIKSEKEQEGIRRAFEVAARAYQKVFEAFDWKGRERDLAGRLEYELRLAGAEGSAFDTIIASGPRSSLPHARSSASTIDDSSLLLIDFGAVKDGFHSDTTRVLWRPPDVELEILEIVKEAQIRAITGIRPGKQASAVDALAREHISARGYGEYFGHSLGHGLGLEIHELPRISSTSETVLEAGMVFTVEPGIYLPGRYGVRWEDAVIVTESGCEVLCIDSSQ